MVKETSDGDAEPYLHGMERDAIATIELFYGGSGDELVAETDLAEYELLSEDELQKLYEYEEEKS